MSDISFFLMLLRTVVVLGLVCGLAYVLFRLILPRLQFSTSTHRLVRIVDRVALDARRNLYVVEVANRWLLIGSSEAGVQLISELDAATVKEEAAAIRAHGALHPLASSERRSSFADHLSRIMNKRR